MCWQWRCPGDPEVSPAEGVHHRNLHPSCRGVTSQGGVLAQIWGGRVAGQGRVVQSWGTHSSHRRGVLAGVLHAQMRKGVCDNPPAWKGVCVRTQVSVRVSHVGISYRRGFRNLWLHVTTCGWYCGYHLLHA